MPRLLNKLNVRRVQGLKTIGWHGDGGCLWLRIANDGSKRWAFIWIRNGRRREMGLGSVAEYSLADAREMATAARQLLKQGLDPIEERNTARGRVASSELRSKPKSKPTRTTPTFGEYARTYIAAHEAGWKNAKHRWQWQNSIDKHAASLLGKRIDAITSDDVFEALKTIWQTFPDTAGRVRGRIEKILDAGRALGHIKGDWENPARWKGNLVYRLPKRVRLSTGHYAAMPYEDVPAFFKELRERPALAARALELTILCATRTSETLKMRWAEIDFDRAIWIIPAERMKMGVEHRIPLPSAAIDLLRSLPGADKAKPSDFVFVGDRGPLSQMSMSMVLRRMKLGHFTVHGMRSSFRDYMGDMTDHSESVIEQALAHQVGNEATRAYRRKDAFDKRRAVMSDWADYLLGWTAADGQRSQALESPIVATATEHSVDLSQ
jgi:integrase